MIRLIPSLDAAIVINAVVTGMDRRFVRDSVKIGLLDSALQAPLAGFGDVDLYPLDHQRLGILCSRVVLNHPFLDGNKRTGFLLMLEAAEMNGIALEFSDQEVAAAQVLALAAGQLSEDTFSEWLVGCIGDEPPE